MSTSLLGELQIYHLQSLNKPIAQARTETILKTGQLEVIRMPLRAGKRLPRYSAPGELLVQCLQGQVELLAGPDTLLLTAGDLVQLDEGTLHALHALDDSLVLLTICRSLIELAPLDRVDEASNESFPASDAPAWIGSAMT